MSNEDSEMEKEYDMRRARRGPIVPPDRRKTRITIRIDTEVLNWFRDQVSQAGGGSYQALINEALRAHVERCQEALEETLRRVIREELQAAVGTSLQPARRA
jgi:uncharacterized protein (DUF4415 family)